MTEILRASIKDGRLDVENSGRHFGNPAPGQVKFCRVTYALDGVERTEDFHISERIVLPRLPPECPVESAKDKAKVGNEYRRSLQTGYAPAPAWEWRGGKLIAWRPIEARLTDASSLGASRGRALPMAESNRTMVGRGVLDPPQRWVKLAPSDPIELKGAWDVSFPDGRGAPEMIRFDALMPWNHHVDSGIKFYAGTAVYECKVEGVKCKVGERVMLDLGEVHDFAEVTVNGKKFPVLWRPPFCIDITDAVASSGDSGETLSLEIKVTNRWPNRFIGDELLHDDDCEWTAIHPKNASERRIARIPDWVENGEKSPTGRRAFSTWKHWKRDERLLDSGLIGPVAVRFGYSGD